MSSHRFRIRPYQPADLNALYRVCLETGDNGGDATRLHDDPAALGNLYVGPYLAYEPDLALVLDDPSGLCGYALGAVDSKAFYRRLEQEWLPPLRARHPRPATPPQAQTPTEQLYDLYHHPEIFCPAPYELYPSHLHIDLLPRAQGQGNGRRLIHQLLDLLRCKGSPGVHLGMALTNDRAHRFYLALGFHHLTERGDTLYLGKAL